jgi:transposase InsO family protein
MWKTTVRKFDVRRRRRQEALVQHGRCPDCRQFVEDAANNRCSMPFVGRFGYHGALRPLFRHPHSPFDEVVLGRVRDEMRRE